MTYAVDDLLPPIILPTRSGAALDFSAQPHAGSTLVFWFTDDDVSDELLEHVERLAPQFHNVNAKLVHVASATPESVRAPSSDALLQAFDPKGILRKTLGLEGSGIIIVDANRRLSAVLADGSPEQMLSLSLTDHADTDVQIPCHAPILMIPRVLDQTLCEALIAYWERSKKIDNAVAMKNGGAGVAHADIKRRTDVVVQDLALYEIVKGRIEQRMLSEMKKCLHFEAARMEALRVGCYDALLRGRFMRHRDNMTPYTAHRKYAVSLNLNQGYAGGAIVFPEYGRRGYRPDAGDAVVFSCSLVHEALPVTDGRRFGLFTFFTDAAGAAQEDEMLAARRGEIPTYDAR